MVAYLDEDWFLSLKIDWTSKLNWLDVHICQVEEEQATNFTECLNDAEGTDENFVIGCFNKYLPDWAK